MKVAHSLLIGATRKLIDLSRLSGWAAQLPIRCPPILWFGNAASQKKRVLTLGANPSRKEFLWDSAKQAIEKVRRSGDQSLLTYIEPPDNRFHLLSCGQSLTEVLASHALREQIIASYNSYFGVNPYTRWFGQNRADSYNVEGFLRGVGASYYDDDSSLLQAIHIDLFPFATLDNFGSIKSIADEALFVDEWAQRLVSQLVKALSPEFLVVFGRANCRHFAKYIDKPMDVRWTPFDSGEWFLYYSRKFEVKVVGLSTNLGNPKGFNSKRLRDFGERVQRAIRQSTDSSPR